MLLSEEYFSQVPDDLLPDSVLQYAMIFFGDMIGESFDNPFFRYPDREVPKNDSEHDLVTACELFITPNDIVATIPNYADTFLHMGARDVITYDIAPVHLRAASQGKRAYWMDVFHPDMLLYFFRSEPLITSMYLSNIPQFAEDDTRLLSTLAQTIHEQSSIQKVLYAQLVWDDNATPFLSSSFANLGWQVDIFHRDTDFPNRIIAAHRD